MPQPDHAPRSVLWLIKGLGAGGAETLLTQSARRLDRTAWSVRVGYLLAHKTALVSELAAAAVDATCLDQRAWWDLRWIVRLRRILRTRDVALVHVHSPAVAVGARLAAWSLGRRRPKLVTTEHNTWASHRSATTIVDAVTFLLDDAHLAVSESVRASLPAPYRRRTEVVAYGVDTAAVTAAADRAGARAELGLSEEDLLVVTVANLRATKGYPDLLDAARGVVDADARVRFVAVGDGPMRAELETRRDGLGLIEHFRFLGSRADAVRVLSAADVFCMASHHEGRPVAMMEAMVLGLPIVATRVGGIPELLRDGEAGVLVAPGRPEALAAALLDLLGDAPRRARVGAAARAATSTLDLAATVRRLEAVYAEVLGG